MTSTDLVVVSSSAEAESLLQEAQSHVATGDRLYWAHWQPETDENLLDSALNAYAQALERQPVHPWAIVQMGKIFFRQGEYAKARQAGLRVESQLGDAAVLPDVSLGQVRHIQREYLYLLGSVSQAEGDYPQAAAYFQKALRIDALHSSRIRFGLFQAYRQLATAGHRMVAHGLAALYQLVLAAILLPFEPERMPLGRLTLLVGQLSRAWFIEEFGSSDEALEAYLTIRRDNPGLASVPTIIGDIYRERGEYGKARYWFEQVIERHPGNLEAHYHLANLMEQIENYADMAVLYEKLTRLRPSDARVYCNLGNAYFCEQKYAQAQWAYEAALRLSAEPQWKALVAQSLGSLYADYLQNTEAAIAYYEMARLLNPAEVENYIQLGVLYFQQEDYTNAEIVYRQALVISPRHARLYSNLGYLRWLGGDADSALQYYQQALELNPEYEIPLNNMGVIYLDSLGQVYRAIELFQRALALNSDYALAYYNLGRAYSFLDNRLEAAQCFQRAHECNQFSMELDNDELTARISHLFESDIT